MEYFHPDQTELTGKKDSVVNFIPNNEIPCIICESSSITEDAFNKLEAISCNNDTQLLSATCQERNDAPPQTSTSDVIDKTISSISSPTTVPSENINNNLSTSLSMSKNTNSYIVCGTKQSYEAIVNYVKSPPIHQSPVINVNSLEVCKDAQKMLKNCELLSGASQESSDDPKKITSDVLDKTISSTSSARTTVPSQNINNKLSCTIIKNTNSDIIYDTKHSEEPTVSASIQSPVINVNSVKRLQGTREKKLLPINSCNPQYKNTPYVRNLPKNYCNVNYSNTSSLRPFSYNKPRVNMMMQPSNQQPLLPTPCALLSTPVHKPLHSMNNNRRILHGVFSSSSEYRSAMRSYLESPVHMQPRMSQTAFPLFPNQGMQVQQNLNPINNRMKLLPNSTRCSSKPSLLPTPIFNYSKPQSKTNVSCFYNSNSFSSMNNTTKSPHLKTPPVQTSSLSLNEPFLPFHSKQILENRPLSREEFNRYCYCLHLNEPEENFEEGDISQASKHDQRKRPLLKTPVLTSSLNLNGPSQCNEKHSSLDLNLQVKELELIKVKQEPIEEEESSVCDNAVPGTSASTSHSYECINHMEWPCNGPPRLTLPSSEYSLYNFDTQSPKKPRLSHCDVDVKPSIVLVDMNMQMPSVGQQQK